MDSVSLGASQLPILPLRMNAVGEHPSVQGIDWFCWWSRIGLGWVDRVRFWEFPARSEISKSKSSQLRSISSRTTV